MNGCSDSERSQFISSAKLSNEEQQAINNLTFLNQRVTTSQQLQKQQFEYTYSENAKKNPKPEFDNAKYHPVLYHIVKSLLENKLDKSSFPYIDKEPNLATDLPKKTKPTWAHRKKVEGTVKGDPIFVFMIGGATCAESKFLEILSNQYNRDIVFGLIIF
jgi:hypothetical protein